MEKDAEENIRHELDDQFADLRELLFAAPPLPTTTQAPIIEPQTGSPEVPKKDDAAILYIAPETQDSAYDQRVRELAFDKRSKPKDRTKTEEELALEAKEALEKAERRRQRRMEGLSESDSEGEGGGRAKRKRGGDDLEDDFYDEDEQWGGLGAGLAQRNIEDDEEEAEGEDDSSDGEEDSAGEDEDDASVFEGFSDDESEEEGEHEQLVRPAKVDKGKGKAKTNSNKELPYTFPCPENHEEFLEIIEGIEDKDIPIVLQRIRALHHTSLAAENKFKLQVCRLTIPPLFF
jgi:nucleolar protein 14